MMNDGESAFMPLCQPIFWFYGLSGAGKTTLTQWVSAELRKTSRQVLVLDGDQFRSGLSRDLAFNSAGRVENIRRAAEVAKLVASQGFIALGAFMTPEREMRCSAKSIVAPCPFYEIFLDCRIETCVERDVKGIYAKAASDLISSIPGKDMPFEVPSSPDLRVDTDNTGIEEAAARVLRFVTERLEERSALNVHALI